MVVGPGHRVRVGSATDQRHLFGRPVLADRPPPRPGEAAVAVGHTILVIAWHILRDKATYQELGGDWFDRRRDPEVQQRRLIRQLEAMGLHVTVEAAARRGSNPRGADKRVFVARYETDRWIYAYMTTSSDNRVVRFRLGQDNRSLADSEVIIQGIDAASTPHYRVVTQRCAVRYAVWLRSRTRLRETLPLRHRSPAGPGRRSA